MKMDKAVFKATYTFIAIHNALQAHGIKPDNDTVFNIMQHAAPDTPSGGSYAIGFQSEQEDVYEEDVTANVSLKKA